MKVLLDTCVWGGTGAVLKASGHDVTWSGDWEQDPGDAEILALAFEEGRVLVTLDKDFGELAVVRGHPHAGIVRLVGFRAGELGPTCVRIFDSYEVELSRGALLTVTPERVRIRPPDE